VPKNPCPKPRLVVLVPCSGAKALEHYPAGDDRRTVATIMATMPAGELYTGSFHRYARHHAERLGADVVIVSALHGLVALDEPLGAYNRTIVECERLETGLARNYSLARAQARRLGLLDPDTVVVAFLPKRYAHHLAAAGIPFVDHLAGSAGIGEHRNRVATVTVGDLIPGAELDEAPQQLALAV